MPEVERNDFISSEAHDLFLVQLSDVLVMSAAYFLRSQFSAL